MWNLVDNKNTYMHSVTCMNEEKCQLLEEEEGLNAINRHKLWLKDARLTGFLVLTLTWISFNLGDIFYLYRCSLSYVGLSLFKVAVKCFYNKTYF